MSEEKRANSTPKSNVHPTFDKILDIVRPVPIHMPSLVGQELRAMRDIKDAIQRRASEIAWEVYKQDYEAMPREEQELSYSRAIDEVREEVLAIGTVELAKRKELGI